MPPRRPALRRPAARVRAPRNQPAREVARDTWLPVEDGPLEHLAIGEKLRMKVSYGGVEGEVIGEILEMTVDALGSWIGIEVVGTTIPSLRHWVLSRGGGPSSRLFCSRTPVTEEKRLVEEGLAYPTEVMALTGDPQVGWARNCREVETTAHGPDENADLRAMAGALGLPQEVGKGVPPPGTAGGGAAVIAVDTKEPLEKESEDKSEKISKRKKVKEMVRRAQWDAKDTPVEINVSLKKRKREASSSTSSSSASSGSYGGIGKEQELKAVSRRLPGYLTRKAAQEGASSLSQGVGEDLKGFQLFLRYYRQVVVPRGGSKPILRELLTLATALDGLIGGNVLGTLDLLSQRFKSLELLQGGADGEVARQLELVPSEGMSLASSAENRFAQAEHSAEQKMRRGLTKVPYQPWSPKGNPKGEAHGSWKGQEVPGKGKGKPKGGKLEKERRGRSPRW